MTDTASTGSGSPEAFSPCAGCAAPACLVEGACVFPKPALNAAQLAFLRFHAEGAAPHQWEWLDDQGGSSPHPAQHVTLRARKRVGAGTRHVRISDADLRALDGYWARPLLEVNTAGLAALAQAAQP